MRFKPKTVLAISVLASLTAIAGMGIMLMQPDAPAETAECKPPATNDACASSGCFDGDLLRRWAALKPPLLLR